MPWDIFRDGEKYCVHKLNSDDEMGERVACHDTRDEAEDQIAALNASENKSAKAHGSYDSREAAEEAAEEIGCSGAHKEGEKWVPCSTKEEYDEIVEGSHDEEDEYKSASSPKTYNMKSYTKAIREVSNAWYDQSDWTGYVHDVTPEHIIVNNNGVHWNVPYEKSGDDISFAEDREWKEVEGKKEWEAAKSYAVKAINDSRIGGYAVIWGDEDRKDLHGEWFDRDTEELKTIFNAIGRVPFLFHHGIDDTVKSTVIGAVDVMEEDDIGLWYEAKIREFEAYKKYVEPLIERKALFTSSGTLPRAKRVNKSGKIKRWPIAEITGTHIPAEYRMLELPIDEIKNAYKSVGIDVTDFEEKFANEDETQNEFETKGVEEARFRIENELRQSKLQLLELEII